MLQCNYCVRCYFAYSQTHIRYAYILYLQFVQQLVLKWNWCFSFNFYGLPLQTGRCGNMTDSNNARYRSHQNETWKITQFLLLYYFIFYFSFYSWLVFSLKYAWNYIALCLPHEPNVFYFIFIEISWHDYFICTNIQQHNAKLYVCLSVTLFLEWSLIETKRITFTIVNRNWSKAPSNWAHFIWILM